MNDGVGPKGHGGVAAGLEGHARISKLHRVAFTISCVVSLGVLCFLTATRLAPYHWIPDVLTSFAAYVAATAVMGAVFSLCSRSNVSKIVACVVAIASLWPVVAEIGLGHRERATGTPVKVIAANVLSRNRDTDRVLKVIRNEQPDIVVLLEANQFWVAETAVLNNEYPFVIAQPRSDNFGIIVRSRLPLTNADVVALSRSEVPTIVADVVINKTKTGSSRSFRLIATHPVPPVGKRNWNDRNEQLANIAALVASHTEPVLLVGDLNVTPWSPFFRSLKSDGGLTDARRAGFGLGTTWNVKQPLFSIPIDHALTTLPVLDYRVGPTIGSDHRPIIVAVDIR